MNNVIGGFSEKQYNSYLICPLDQPKWKSIHWISYLNITHYPTLAILVNRMAYIILHGFKEYLDNKKLFQKFKSHDFAKIDSKVDYRAAKRLVNRFDACIEIDKTDVNSIREALKEIKQKLFKEEVTTPKENENGSGNSSVIAGGNAGGSNNSQTVAGNEVKPVPNNPPVNPTITPTIGPTPPIPLNLPVTPDPIDPDDPDGPLPVPEPDQEPKPIPALPPALVPVIPDPNPPSVDPVVIKVLEPLPKEIEAILDKSFPLSEEESIQDLYKALQNHNNKKRLVEYQKNLAILRQFALKLALEKKETDPRFKEYMEQVDGAFLKAWKAACEQAAGLHEAFKTKFPEGSANYCKVNVSPNGDVLCSLVQLEWVIKQINQHFPAIYALSFDAPSLNIDQELKMARLAQLILGGEDAKQAPQPSHSFIRLDITNNVRILEKSDTTQDASSTAAGASIENLVFGSEKIAKDDEKKRSLMLGIAEGFVSDWLKRKGTTLKFPGNEIESGSVQAKEWVASLRDAYVSYLEELSREDVEALITSMLSNSFLKLGLEAFQKDMTPDSLIGKLFEDQLDQAVEDEVLRAAIQKTIDDAIVVDPIKIKALDPYPEELQPIEPMVGSRILYLLPLLTDKVNAPIIAGIQERVKAFFDPVVCQKASDAALTCRPGKKQITLDEAMSVAEITVNTIFEDPIKGRIVGSAQSSHSTSSKGIETKDLKFSIYSSVAQRKFLVAQFVPTQVITAIETLAQEVSQLDILKKAQDYLKAKADFDKSLWGWIKSFNKTPYYDFKKNVKGMDLALRKAQIYVTLLNTHQFLTSKKQLGGRKRNNLFEKCSVSILYELMTIVQVMGELIEEGDGNNPEYSQTIGSYMSLELLLNSPKEKS